MTNTPIRQPGMRRAAGSAGVVLCGLMAAFAQALPVSPSATTSSTRMMIEMRPGETHPTDTSGHMGGRLSRWIDPRMASVSSRYHFIHSAAGRTTADNQQYQVALRGGFKFDARGRYSVQVGVFSGNAFTLGWNNSGWGTGRAQSNLFLKQLYVSAMPLDGVEFQYGGLDIRRGEATEVVSYDYDGYVVGERLVLTRPKDFYFNDITVTVGYLGDVNRPNVLDRLHRLGRANYHQIVVGKHFGETVRVSAEYSSEGGVGTFREAVRMRSPVPRVLDRVLVEAYQRTGAREGFGVGIHGEKMLGRKLTVGGGFTRIDRTELTADRFPQGKRLHFDVLYALTPEVSLTVGFTQAVGTVPPAVARTRLDIAFNFNLLRTLHRTGLF